MRFQLPTVKQQSEFIPLKGGLDVVTPMISIPPGFVRDSVNVEEDINGGYASLSGYERYSGQPSPSSATYSKLTFTSSGTVAVGDTITGATSGATGVVLAVLIGRFILTKITGTWAAETTVAGGATVSGPVIGVSMLPANAALYTAAAADVLRADIAVVTGVGSILGVWYYGGNVYAFRNKSTTGVGMYKSTAFGWAAVALGYEIAFSNANTSVNEADVLTQGAVTATITRVVVETGTLASGTNTGRLIISAPSGGNYAAGAATSTGGGALTLSAIQTAITIPNQSGRFEFVNNNFAGRTGTLRMYGVDGMNRAFEFDGTVFVPINCGTGIFPKHVAAHQDHLFVSYLSSILHSAIGDPYNWSSIAGAGELAMGDDVTGLMPQPGSDTAAAIAIYCRNRTKILYGSNAASWTSPVNFSDEIGAIPYSIQKIGKTYVFDDRGITTLSSAQEFGNFANAAISQRIKTWLSPKRGIVSDSHVARDKQQYRIFFSDGSAAYWTISDAGASMMPVILPNSVTCSCSSELFGGGEEVIFFGSTNGFVYQMDKGTSFDGAAISWYADLVFNYSKAYRALKQYRRMTFELSGAGYCVFQSTYSLSYGSDESAQPDNTSNEVALGAPVWDQFVWDQFVWDGSRLTPLSMATPGDGENIAIRVSASSNYYSRVTFSGVFLEFSTLRMMR